MLLLPLLRPVLLLLLRLVLLGLPFWLLLPLSLPLLLLQLLLLWLLLPLLPFQRPPRSERAGGVRTYPRQRVRVLCPALAVRVRRVAVGVLHRVVVASVQVEVAGVARLVAPCVCWFGVVRRGVSLGRAGVGERLSGAISGGARAARAGREHQGEEEGKGEREKLGVMSGHARDACKGVVVWTGAASEELDGHSHSAKFRRF